MFLGVHVAGCVLVCVLVFMFIDVHVARCACCLVCMFLGVHVAGCACCMVCMFIGVHVDVHVAWCACLLVCMLMCMLVCMLMCMLVCMLMLPGVHVASFLRSVVSCQPSLADGMRSRRLSADRVAYFQHQRILKTAQPSHKYCFSYSLPLGVSSVCFQTRLLLWTSKRPTKIMR